MTVTVKLFAWFREGRFREAALSCEDGATPAEIIASLGIDPDDVGVIMVNNRHADPGLCLEEGDVLAVFPKIGGG